MSDSQTPEFETDNGFLELIQPRDEKYMEELEEDTALWCSSDW